MAATNAEAVRAVYERWAAGDFRAPVPFFAPDVVFDPVPEPGEIRGVENVAAYMQEFLAQWSEYRVEAVAITEAGDEVVVEERQHATGKASGVGTVQAFFATWTFAGDRAVRVRWAERRPSAR